MCERMCWFYVYVCVCMCVLLFFGANLFHGNKTQAHKKNRSKESVQLRLVPGLSREEVSAADIGLVAMQPRQTVGMELSYGIVWN